MKAKVNLNNNKVLFETLTGGDFFVYNNILYIKTSKIFGNNVNAVNVHNGNLAFFDKNVVENVSCEIIVGYCGDKNT